jgi:Flp pilus assembly pilin Flp
MNTGKEVNAMLWLSLRFGTWVHAASARFRELRRRDDGQASAEYALVILAAAAVALVLIAWAQSTGKLTQFFDNVIDNLINSAP